MTNLDNLIENAEWLEITTAPRYKRILILTESGEQYVGHWAKNPFTDDEAWIIAEYGDEGDQLLVKPVKWMPLDTPTRMAEVIKVLREELHRQYDNWHSTFYSTGNAEFVAKRCQEAEKQVNEALAKAEEIAGRE